MEKRFPEAESKKEIDIEKSFQKALTDEILLEYDIECLLYAGLEEEKQRALRGKAREIAAKEAGNQGKIWASIGLDYVNCPMNCSFCSMGSAWNSYEKKEELQEKEVVEIADYYARQGADWLVLRTTEFYEFDRLIQRIKAVRQRIKNDCVLVVNTGDANSRKVEELKAAGVDMIYQAFRLREGTDTRFDCNARRETIKMISQSGLKLSQYLEPVGPEHTDRELAGRMTELIRQGTDVAGIMERVPVSGTPKYTLGTMLPQRIAQITAVLRIASRASIRDIVIHPYHRPAVECGANALVVDVGAIPRSRGMTRTSWKNQDMLQAKQFLKESGYEVDDAGNERNERSKGR